MKLILENWRKYLTERIYSDPSKVKIVSDILYYKASFIEPGRLFVVAEFDLFAGGPRMKFGFYTSSAESDGDESKLPAGSWVPVVGIRDPPGGWIMKIEGKYPHPHSLLAMVGTELGKRIPLSTQNQIKMENKRKWNQITRGVRGARFSGPEREQKEIEAVQQQIKDINSLFKSHGVYDIEPVAPSGMRMS